MVLLVEFMNSVITASPGASGQSFGYGVYLGYAYLLTCQGQIDNESISDRPFFCGII